MEQVNRTATNTTEDISMKLHMSERVGYVFGAFGMQLNTETISTYLLLFQTTCMGLDAKAAGLMFLLGRFVDAITDTIMANFADKTRTRWGSYRPYLLFGCVPLGIIFALNFWYPSFLQTDTAKLVWCYLMYFLAGSVCATVCGVNYGAMAAVITTDRVERAKLAASRTIGEQLAALTYSALVMTIVIHFGGQSNVTGWRVVGVLFGCMAIISWLICFATSRERVEVVPKGKEPTPLKVRAKVFVGNKPAFGMMGIMVLTFFGLVYMGTLFAYYCIYVLGRPDWTASLATVGASIAIVVALIIPRLLGRFEKRHMLVTGALICVFAHVVLFFAKTYSMVLVYQVIKGIGTSCLLSNIWSIIPDTADYGEWKNGVAAPGLVYSVMLFLLKCTTGAASFVVASILSAVGFKGTLAVQEASTISGIHNAIIIGPIIIMTLLALCTLLLKSIDKKNLDHVIDELNAMRLRNRQA